ncbi:hypothetical protein [Streptomyces sp. NPDC002402]
MGDNVARIIAGASPLGTALNMTVGYLTYRRVRPRVDVLVEKTQWEDGPTSPSVLLSLRIKNRSATPVQVENVRLEVSWNFLPRRTPVPMLTYCDDIELKIPALDGVKHDFRCKAGLVTGRPGRVKVRVAVGLSTGRTVKSRRLERQRFEEASFLPRQRSVHAQNRSEPRPGK